MAHVGQKDTLGAVRCLSHDSGFIRRIFGLSQFLLRLLALGDVPINTTKTNYVTLCV